MKIIPTIPPYNSGTHKASKRRDTENVEVRNQRSEDRVVGQIADYKRLAPDGAEIHQLVALELGAFLQNETEGSRDNNQRSNY